MALKELIVATIFIFVLAVFMLVAAPTVDKTSRAANTSDLPGNESVGFDPGAKIGMIKYVALALVPTMGAVGFVIYAYAAIVRDESYQGRM